MAQRGEVELGDMVEDNVTGFQGIVVGIYTYLHGCRRIGIEPRVGDDGKMHEGYTIDEPRLIVRQRGLVRPTTFDTGGPTTRGSGA